MSLLFDISPEEPERKKSRRKGAEQTPKPEKTEAAFAAPARELQIMGQIDDVYTCPDDNCRATFHDIIDEHNSRWLIECCFCGTGQWVWAIEGVLREPDAFVFRDGVFEGLSIDEAVKRENGMDYVQWAAEKHKRPAVREACRKWLDVRGSAV